jgi:hypothetical protein
VAPSGSATFSVAGDDRRRFDHGRIAARSRSPRGLHAIHMVVFRWRRGAVSGLFPSALHAVSVLEGRIKVASPTDATRCDPLRHEGESGMNWPDGLRMRTIDTWPGERTRSRKVSPFRASLRDTLEVLDRELRALKASNVWLEVAIPPEMFRLDGRPRAGARAEHPGVVVSFTSRTLGKELRYATDRFTAWQDNLRAVALGLEALRKVERYGIANRGEQYAGWTQLSAGGPSPDRGRDLIGRHGGLTAALRATHPDTSGYDSAGDFADVQAARA